MVLTMIEKNEERKKEVTAMHSVALFFATICLFATVIYNLSSMMISSHALYETYNNLRHALKSASELAYSEMKPVIVSAKSGDWASGWTISVGGKIFEEAGAINDRVHVLHSNVTVVEFGPGGHLTSSIPEIQMSDSSHYKCISVSQSGDLQPEFGICKTYDVSKGLTGD